MNRCLLALLACIGALCCLPPALATTIAGPFSLGFTDGSGSLLSSSVTTASPGGSAGNLIEITERIDSYNSGVWQLGFSMPSNNEGATAYLVTKTVINNTNVGWEDFQIAMGCGNVGEEVCTGFDPLLVDYGVTPGITESGAFLDVTLPHLFHWSGMSVGVGEAVTFMFGIETCANCQGSWAIYQKPSLIPEPGTLALSLCGFTLLLMRRRSRCCANEFAA